MIPTFFILNKSIKTILPYPTLKNQINYPALTGRAFKKPFRPYV
jgi:hypothetical protein